METKASLRGAHLSAQKGRLVADLVRGKKVDQAINILAFSPKAGAAPRLRRQHQWRQSHG